MKYTLTEKFDYHKHNRNSAITKKTRHASEKSLIIQLQWHR